MEILDLYDDNGVKLNETIVRGEKTETGKNIMLSVVYIQDSDGRYLIQKTSKEKGNKYSTTGGHVTHNEDAITTIVRELKEELGINIKSDKLEFVSMFKYPTKNCIFNIYNMNLDKIDIKNIILQDSEVESVKLMTKEEIVKNIDDGNFLESHGYIFKHFIN